MVTFKSAAAFAAETNRLADTLNRDLRRATREMAEDARELLIDEAVRDVGGDAAFSGWFDGGSRNLDNIVIKRGKREGVNDTSHWIFPTKKSAGPWQVAERGRYNSNAGGFSGPGLNRRTGITSRTKKGNIRKVSAPRSIKRWTGPTAGMATASRAGSKIERMAKGIADDRFKKALSKHFDVT